jgi:2-polyprenyl-6-hydroxyphenyl methylase/3-demethylubiquinone-9 3-methyltransferase
MSLGPRIRGLFGQHERAIADVYRSIFIDLDHLIDQLKAGPAPSSILELGCGEGAVTSRLSRAFPDAAILGVDVTPRVGRLFDGRGDKVSFEQKPVQQVALERPGSFDLLIAVDVIHHIPPAERLSVLQAARKTLASGGVFAIKDWIRGVTPIHGLCWLSDRFLTGDDVRYCSLDELRALLHNAFGVPPTEEGSVRPWRHNRLLLGRVA